MSEDARAIAEATLLIRNHSKDEVLGQSAYVRAGLVLVGEVARLEDELAGAREALNIMAYTTEAELTNWKGDFQEACRQRDKVEAERDALRAALRIVGERLRAGAPIGHEWSVSTEEIISEALGHE